MRIPAVFARPVGACFTVTSVSASRVTVLPFRNVMSATPPAPVRMRSPSARFMPLIPGSGAPASLAMRSTGAVSTLRVAVTAPWAIASAGTSRGVIRTNAITVCRCHLIVRLLVPG